MTLLVRGEPVAPPLPKTARPVAAIEAELDALREQITSQEKELEKAKAAADQLVEKRIGLVVKARVDLDARAEKRLETITPDVDAATHNVADFQVVIGELRARVKVRLGERLVAERVARLDALTAAATAMLPVSQELDQLLKNVVEQAGAWVAGQTTVYSLAVDLGMTAMLRTPRQQLSDVLNGIFFPLAPNQFDKPFRPGEISFTGITARHADPSVLKEKERNAS